MERLTEKIGNTNCVKGCGSNCKYGFQHCRTEDWENCKTIDDVIDKLAQYEELEEQGLLLRLPAEAYFIKDNIVRKGWVQELVYSPCRRLLLDIRYDDNSLDSYRGYVGDTISLMQEAAEQRLKEMEK